MSTKKKSTPKPPKQPGQINMHDVAVMVTLMEGKKVSLPVAQVSEVLACLKKVADAGSPNIRAAIFEYLGGKP